jgi:S-layer homology domain
MSILLLTIYPSTRRSKKMNKQNIRLSPGQAAWLGLALALCAILLFIGGSSNSAQAGSPTPKTSVSAASPDVTCPAGQCFTDVPPANGFYTYVNNLYMDGIIGGYACGGTGEPCDADSRPYYRPANLVSRQQMSKFVDLGRRNIADAIGNSLYISTTAGIAGDFETRSGGEAVYAECLQSGNNCYALEGYAPTGDYAGYMYGGKGVYAESDDSGYPAVHASAYSTTAYGIHAESANYRGGYVKSSQNGFYSLYVDTQDGPTQATAGLEVNGSTRMEGNLYVAGSKAGYVVDIMQNSDTASLEAGDVVTIVGNSSPVLGAIPVVNVKKAGTA